MQVTIIIILIANAAILFGAFLLFKSWMRKSNKSLNKIIFAQDQIGSASVNLDDTLQVIVDQLMEITGASGAAIELVEGDEIFYRAASGALGSFKDYRMKFLNSLSGHCIAYGEVVNCPDTEKDKRVNHEATRKFNIRSMVVAPLSNDGENIGVLKVSSEKLNAFSKRDVQTVKLLCNLIGASIARNQNHDVNKDEQLAVIMPSKETELLKSMLK